ncbi:hypothetical protein GCM10009638_15290 [Luteococcus sanguinis]
MGAYSIGRVHGHGGSAMNDDRDVDARFCEIIGAEFGTPVPRAPLQAPAAHQAPTSDFNLQDALDEAEPSDSHWSRHTPDTPPPMTRPRSAVLLGIVLMGGGLLVTVLGLFGANFSRAITWAGIIASLVGLATLLMSTPRRRIDPWDDGARL